jgi:hypothetical protein
MTTQIGFERASCGALALSIKLQQSTISLNKDVA